jgi:membrane protein DedA with SNARE-associated domain
VFLTPQRLDDGGDFFNHHGGKVVTIARFVEGLRQVNGLLSGIVGMHWLKFLGFNALGAVLWVCAWAGLGHLAGEHVVEIYDAFGKCKWYAIGAAALIVAALVARRARARRRHAAA